MYLFMFNNEPVNIGHVIQGIISYPGPIRCTDRADEFQCNAGQDKAKQNRSKKNNEIMTAMRMSWSREYGELSEKKERAEKPQLPIAKAQYIGMM